MVDSVVACDAVEAVIEIPVEVEETVREAVTVSMDRVEFKVSVVRVVTVAV